jgi:hypothetical protein
VFVDDCLADNGLASQQRLQMMEQEIVRYAIDPPPAAPPQMFQFGTKPLFRYSDPTRGTYFAHTRPVELPLNHDE